MKLTIELAGKPRVVEFTRGPDGLACWIDGAAIGADVAEVTPGVYSILIEGRCFEVRVEPRVSDLLISVAGQEYAVAVRDPREWQRQHGGAAESQGRQQVVAPMPGKVVRVLARAGEAIEAGQGVVVVEAMKMQNEVKAPKSGKVERVLVSEGQSVNAGEVLAVVA
jgi:biotin carboxyl carrier protein